MLSIFVQIVPIAVALTMTAYLLVTRS